MSFFERLIDFNTKVNDFIWVKLGLILLLGTGMLMTLRTGGFQFRYIGHWLKNTVGSLFNKKVSVHSHEKASISQFQALCTALAATVGVGNIAGVAAAIATGGPGAVFWMWIAALFGMITSYSESVLGIYYRRKNKAGEWTGIGGHGFLYLLLRQECVFLTRRFCVNRQFPFSFLFSAVRRRSSLPHASFM